MSFHGRLGWSEIGRSSKAIIGPSNDDYNELCHVNSAQLTLDVRRKTPSVPVQCVKMALRKAISACGILPLVSPRTSSADLPHRPLGPVSMLPFSLLSVRYCENGRYAVAKLIDDEIVPVHDTRSSILGL